MPETCWYNEKVKCPVKLEFCPIANPDIKYCPYVGDLDER